MCYPTIEGGLGVRHLGSIQDAFSFKIWTMYPQSDTLWGKYMCACYSGRVEYHLRLYDSIGWKRICEIHAFRSSHAEMTGRIPLWLAPSSEFTLSYAYDIVRPSQASLQSQYFYLEEISKASYPDLPIEIISRRPPHIG